MNNIYLVKLKYFSAELLKTWSMLQSMYTVQPKYGIVTRVVEKSYII